MSKMDGNQRLKNKMSSTLSNDDHLLDLMFIQSLIYPDKDFLW